MVGDGFAIAALCALMPLSGSQAATGHAEREVSATLASSTLAGHARVHLKIVRYRGYAFLVPRSWPVIDDRTQSRGCVRFDQHAIYLGAVRGDEFCPSWLLGTTESMLIQAGPARSARGSAENPVAREITARAPGIAISATFGTDPTVIYRILASASLPPPVILQESPAKAAAAGHLDGAASRADRTRGASPRSPRMRQPMPPPALPTAVASYRGLGFDACTAPSRSAMRAWRRRSPYRAIGIYIGGADRACAQPNLSQAWVRAEARAGWRFIPLYAGPQAAFGELHAPVRQGLAAARDAVAQARRLGFGRRTPIYYDMEAYNPGVRIAALRFLSAWTVELHRLRYSSGVYSSSDSGIADLSRQYARRTYAMPNVIYDALWNGSASTSDRNLRAGQWHLKRIHQFSGNVTQRFGGHTINIDKDFLDVRLRAPVATSQATSATLPDGSVDLFYRLQGSQLWFDRYSARTGWASPVRTSAGASSLPSVVYTGSAVDVFYTRSGGNLWVDSYQADGKLSGRHQLSMMGKLGSAPRAVAQPGGVIDVFWRGSADDHLWHGQYVPGSGWYGPQGLGGDLGSDPVPVVSSPGITTVLWKGRDASLWSISRGLLGRWSSPRSLGMGPLGGQPQATAQPSGGIQVYWHGSGNSFVWEGFYRPGTGWLGPRDLGGEVRSVPWPATAAGTVRVLWRGPGNRLTYIRHRLGRRWNLAEWQEPRPLRTSWLGSAPFAAVGSPGAALQVFWPGRHDRLWTAALRAGGWTKPIRIAG